jgi:hypothetical protein
MFYRDRRCGEIWIVPGDADYHLDPTNGQQAMIVCENMREFTTEIGAFTGLALHRGTDDRGSFAMSPQFAPPHLW